MSRLPSSVAAALEPLPSRLRQSVKEQVSETLMSYLARAEASRDAVQEAHARKAGNAADGTPAHQLGGQPPPDSDAPGVPLRRRRMDVEPARVRTLAALAQLADAPSRERALVAELLRTREQGPVAIPFVGVHANYGCGLYYQRENRRFYARLDVVSPKSRAARPLTVHGRYIDLKTGIEYAASNATADNAARTTATDDQRERALFRRSRSSMLVSLECGRYHEEMLRYTHAAFLPQRGIDPRHPEPAVPVTAQLVRHVMRGEVRYQLHVCFRLPESPSVQGDQTSRPILALNRGIYHLYSAVVTTPDASQEMTPGFAASGMALLQAQRAMERRRRLCQQRGREPTARDRRQHRIARHHVALAANQIVDAALRHGAQVVCEDLGTFARGQAQRALRKLSRKWQRAARALLNRRQFEALRQAIEERLALAGLPPLRLVSAAGISQFCPRCGHRAASHASQSAVDGGNGTDARLFHCQVCGTTMDIDEVGALNIARRSAWLRLRYDEAARGLGEDARTPWETFLVQVAQRWQAAPVREVENSQARGAWRGSRR